MAIPFADILQDEDLPVSSVGVYMHFNDIIFYAPSEHICTEMIRHDENFCKISGVKTSHFSFGDTYH
jgi:hypothetical protein